jgi:hypothetical protein
MIVTKKALPRRMFLRGMGTALALPFLDAMAPALAGAPLIHPKRLGFLYVPMGAHRPMWTPPGADLSQLSPTLTPLAKVREYCTVVEGMELRNAYPGTHSSSNAAFLSAATSKWTESSDYYLGTTVDQVAAKVLGQETRLPSLELSMDLLSVVGQCDNGYACVYQNNLSWSSPTTPLPSIAHPRIAFERLFGDGGSASDRLADMRANASLLDWMKQDISRLQKKLGPSDRNKVSEYLDTVREVERRIQKAESSTADSHLPDLDRPVGVPAQYSDHAKLMMDQLVHAWKGDVTRVTVFQLARETSNRAYTEIGIGEGHHPLTHNGGNPQMLAKCAQINAFHASMFAYLLEKLKGTADGDGNLLDHSALLYGSGMSNADLHDHTNLPIIVAGGKPKSGGRFLRFPEHTPLANLHLTLLDRVGVSADSFADSTGKVRELIEPLTL